MEPPRQIKFVKFNRGLYVLRYMAAEDNVCPPKIEVLVDGGNNSIELFLHPDSRETVLWEPGASLVVCAESSGELEVHVIATKAGGSTAATLRVEPLTQGDPKPGLGNPRGSAISDRGNDQGHTSSFRVLGHVAQIGDVCVNSHDWIAGPSAPARIEGISFEWLEKPENIGIMYSVKLPNQHPPSGEMMRLGEYAGTRRRALPIVGLVLEMTGPGAPKYQFVVEAIFLGSSIMRTTGQQVALAGPTGQEPLVGLRVGIEQTATPARGVSPRNKPAPPTASRVRVFRSRTNQSQHNVP